MQSSLASCTHGPCLITVWCWSSQALPPAGSAAEREHQHAASGSAGVRELASADYMPGEAAPAPVASAGQPSGQARCEAASPARQIGGQQPPVMNTAAADIAADVLAAVHSATSLHWVEDKDGSCSCSSHGGPGEDAVLEWADIGMQGPAGVSSGSAGLVQPPGQAADAEGWRQALMQGLEMAGRAATQQFLSVRDLSAAHNDVDTQVGHPILLTATNLLLCTAAVLSQIAGITVQGCLQ